jgi:uncharacterized protein involved in exopolysaccharide biosynthesis
MTNFKYIQIYLVQVWLIFAKKKYWLLGILSISALFGYYQAKKVKPKYVATITFVLAPEQKPNLGSGFSMQMIFNNLNDNDNIFSGQNILNFFKSRKIIGKSLTSVTDTNTNELLVNLIARKHFKVEFKKIGVFENDPAKYSPEKIKLFREIITYVENKFVVYKKDKNLVFHSIETTDTSPEVSYYISKNVLSQTSKYFIETKTKVKRENIKLLQHVSDSISAVISNLYLNSARINDRTFNLNPSVSILRSKSSFINTKIMALNEGYRQLISTLGNAKMSLRQETPLYQIIDMPDLPLTAIRPNYYIYITISVFLTFLISLAIVIVYVIIKTHKRI